MQAEKVTAIHSHYDVRIETGIVQSSQNNRFQIITQTGSIMAVKAFSCLMEPQPGDIVIFSAETGSASHILSITERPDSGDARLKFEGDLTFNVTQGQLHLNAQQGLNLSSQQDINLASEEVAVLAKKAFFGIDSVNAIGEKLVARIDNIQSFAQTLETVAEQLLQKFKNAFRVVEGIDQSRAQDVIHTAKNLYSMNSRQAAIIAKKDIKVDAERIHMG